MEQPYDIGAFPPFAVTVDLVLLEIREAELCVLVVKRGNEPHKGEWALPGGFVRRGPAHPPESLEQAAARELREETGLALKRVPYLAQLGAYGDPGRDPRGDIVTVAYLAVTAHAPKAHPGGDADAVGWLPVENVLAGAELAFDHNRIVTDGVERVRDLIQYTALATAFCGPRFSIANLRRAYEIIWGRTPEDFLDPGNFQKRIQGMPRLLREASAQARPVGHEQLGLESRPRPMSFHARAASPAGASVDLTEAGEGADVDVLLPARSARATSESFTASTPRGGPRPVLYEPGPLIRESGFDAPLERPVLNHPKAAAPASLAARRRRPKASL